MPRSPVTLVIQGFNALTEDEKKLCLDFIAPEPEPEPQAKPKKRRTRTPRTGLPDPSKDTKADIPKSNGQLCKWIVPGLDIECAEPEANLIHDPTAGYVGYHPFSIAAQPAEKKSRRKGAAANSTPNTETNSEGALAVGAGGD